MMILSLGACSSVPQRIEVTSKPIPKPELVLPKVDTVSMRKIEWVVITEENMEAELDKWTKGGKPLAIFALNAKGYEALGMNFSDIRALVQQQQAIIAAYENYYKAANKAMDEAETQRQQEEAADAAREASQDDESLVDKLNPFK